jgi:hypothetical protein
MMYMSSFNLPLQWRIYLRLICFSEQVMHDWATALGKSADVEDYGAGSAFTWVVALPFVC